MKIRLVWLGLLALASPPAAVTAQESRSETISGTRLSVTGEGRVTRPPDYVGIVAGVTTEAPLATSQATKRPTPPAASTSPATASPC